MPGPEIPLGLIARVEKMGGQSNKAENAYGLELICSDLRTLRFGFIPENHSRKQVYEAINHFAFPASNNLDFFAFAYSATFEIEGWSLYSHKNELARVIAGGSEWRISAVNEDYKLCDTYPSQFAVPAAVDDTALENAAKFRTRNRLPALSWVHPGTRASITRCSQPKVGPWRRNEQDEALIKAIQGTNPRSQKLVIMDARPKVNAVANQAKGAGYESAEVYENTEILFMNIPNIHVIRDSHRRVRDLCYPRADDLHWHAKLEDTHWLEYNKLILQSAVMVVDLVQQGTSVMVHCSDGWDRTPQITALAMMLLDPFYRTVMGFATLIEKEWLGFSHKFAQRFGQGNRNHGDEQRAPIFSQFLDCVQHLLTQFPTAFELNETLLQFLGDEIYTCRFGTFLFNSEKERQELRAREKTRSAWSHVIANLRLFSNPLYVQQDAVLSPVMNARRMQLWPGNYLRWSPEMRKADAAMARQWELRNLVDSLQEQVTRLQGQEAK